MTLMDQIRSQAGGSASSLRRQEGQQDQTEQNVGSNERVVSIASGAAIAMLGLSRGSLPGLLLAGVGGALVYRGASGHCSMYQKLGINTAEEGQQQSSSAEEISERGIHVEQSFLINKSPEELYRYWRNFENLPRIMSHLERVTVQDDRRSHWVVKAPRLAGGSVEWDAEITADEPNSRIAWRSVGNADVENAGEIRFTPAMADRGTDVHVYMDYIPPAGRVGKWISTLLGENPSRVVREDLRNFKRIMEIGEILTIIGQPHGTCTGQGKRYTESEWKPHFM